MKLWHVLFSVFLLALCLAIARDPIGRVALIVFFTTAGMMVLGVTAVMMLFRTVGEIGSADTLPQYAEALVATAGVLFFGAASMLMVLWCGLWMIQAVVP